MSQFNLDTPINPTTKSGSVLASDLSSWRDAIHSSHIGNSRPTYAVAGTFWVDNSATPWIVNFYDGADDIRVGTINATTNVFIPGYDAATVFGDIKQVATTAATGVVELATAAEAEGRTSTTVVTTPDSLAKSTAAMWVVFGATGTIKESMNVSSVTRTGQGQFTVNFGITMPDINYAVVLADDYVNEDGSTNLYYTAKTTSTVAVRFAHKLNNGGAIRWHDPVDASVIIFGN